MNIDIFLNQNLQELTDCLFRFNQTQMMQKYTAQRYYLPNCISNNYSVIVNGKNFYDQSIDSDIKRYQEIKKLTGHILQRL